MVNSRRVRWPTLSGKPRPGGLWLAWSLALSSTLAFSLATPFARLVLDQSDISPTLLLVLRFCIGIVLLAATLRFIAPDKLRMDRRGTLLALAIGLENGIGVLCYFWSLTRLNASIATMLFTVYPLLVLGLLALRGEKLTYRHLVRVLLGLGGIFLVLGPAGKLDWVGVLLVLITICCISLELVLIQWFLQPYDARSITLYVMAGMLMTISGYWLWQGAEWHNPGWPAWLYIVLLGSFCTFFAWWAMFTGLRTIGSGQIAMLVPLETLLTIIWTFLLLGERFSFWQVVGSGLILLSAVLAIQRLRRTSRRLLWAASPALVKFVRRKPPAAAPADAPKE
ncbi:MAG: hypothetical protein Kow0031_29310 [Anaerolineae bacterium]